MESSRDKSMTSQPTVKMADLPVYQGNIIRNVIGFTSLAIVFSAVAYRLIPADRFTATMTTPADRLVFTLRCNVPTIIMVFAMVCHIANTRFASRQMNPLVTDDRDKIEIHCRVLQNTLEQFVMSFVAQLITSTWLEPSQMAVIPIVVVLFVVGRILFWHGYLDPAMNRTNRSRGLPLSIFATFALLVFCFYKLVTGICAD